MQLSVRWPQCNSWIVMTTFSGKIQHIITEHVKIKWITSFLHPSSIGPSDNRCTFRQVTLKARGTPIISTNYCFSLETTVTYTVNTGSSAFIICILTSMNPTRNNPNTTPLRSSACSHGGVCFLALLSSDNAVKMVSCAWKDVEKEISISDDESIYTQHIWDVAIIFLLFTHNLNCQLIFYDQLIVYDYYRPHVSDNKEVVGVAHCDDCDALLLAQYRTHTTQQTEDHPAYLCNSNSMTLLQAATVA